MEPEVTQLGFLARMLLPVSYAQEGVISGLVWLISRFDSREVAFQFAFVILGAAVYAWRKLNAARREHVGHLEDAIRVLQLAGADRGGRTPTQQAAALALASRSLSPNPAAGESWRSYAAGFRPDPGRRGMLINPLDPEDWFERGRLRGRGYEKWASTLSGVFLTAGLFFTFVGLSAALFRVGDAGSDPEQLRSAINDILRISSAKFVTSMAGIIAFIGWTVTARAWSSEQERLSERLSSAVRAMSPPVNAESLLLRHLEHAASMDASLASIAGGGNASTALAEAAARLSDAADALAATAGRNRGA